MIFGKYKCFCQFSRDAVLPPYKGSTFRGAFDMSLKDITCVPKSDDCAGCPLQKKCVYFRVLEVEPCKSAQKSGDHPHPFVIEPPESTQQNFAAGDMFDFDLLLFGFTNEILPYFVYAFEEMGRRGLGKFLGGRRPGFRLLKVTSHSHMIFDSNDRTVNPGNPTDLSLQTNPDSDDTQERQLTIRLQTPLRLKFKNRFAEELPFHLLVRSMLRRISSLNNSWGSGEPPLDYSGLIKRAEEIRIVDSSLEWLDWSRFSNRQQTRMQLGGITGAITYAGKLEEYLSLVRYCEIVHLGKNTTFGLGKIKMDNMA